MQFYFEFIVLLGKMSFNLPPITPTKKYKASTVLQKAAAMSPVPERQPPSIIIGRPPYLFTRILLIGPVDNRMRKDGLLSI